MCGELKATPHGKVVFGANDTAHYVCDYGYKLVGEDKVILWHYIFTCAIASYYI